MGLKSSREEQDDKLRTAVAIQCSTLHFRTGCALRLWDLISVIGAARTLCTPTSGLGSPRRTTTTPGTFHIYSIIASYLLSTSCTQGPWNKSRSKDTTLEMAQCHQTGLQSLNFFFASIPVPSYPPKFLIFLSLPQATEIPLYLSTYPSTIWRQHWPLVPWHLLQLQLS